MFEVFIIKIESPDCFWGSIKGGGNFVDNEMAYKKLQFEMNQFYNLTHRGLDEVKPSVLKEGQVCVVYSQEENSWCRAIVESIISCTDNYLAECFLVDYAKNIPVKAEKICCALESFMRLPYRAQKFRLYHIKPVTLRVNYYTNNAEIVPATKWNIAAIRYFQDLLDAASQVEAKLCAVEDDTFAVYLYVTKRGEKVCVNDDLVAKNFASSEKNEERSIIMEEQNQEILGLESVSVSEISPAHILSPTSLDIKEPKAVEMCECGRLSVDNKRDLKMGLKPILKIWKKFVGPNHVQSYSWPAIARGYDSVVICPENDPLIYLLPIITFLQSRNCYLSLPARNGPVALIICTRQRKAELVFEFVEKYTHCSRPLHPLLLSVGMNKEEIKSVRIPRGCELIVTTPYSLLRLLECHSLMFLRLCHLVLDEAEALFSEANDQVFNILEHYKRSLNDEVKEYVPQQIVAIGSRWTKKLEYLTKEFMNDPYVVITSLEEAAIYGNIQQVVQVSLECNRISILLQTLDFTPHNAQKTLIFTSSVEETDNICKVSPLAKEQPKAKSILLLTENSAWHTVGVLDYLKRTEANIPPELHDFTSGVLDAKENCKSGKPFCRYLKVYGFCKDKKRCPDRHRISLQVDFPKGERNSTQPTAGNVTILPLFIVDATNYFGRIVDKTKDQYTALEKEMHQYYKKSSNCISVSLVEKLALYGVHEKNYIHRVQVLQIAPKEGKCVFYSIHVKYIDEGRTGQVQNYQLLSLPEHFQVLPPQAVEFIVCRVKPIDNEAEWNPKVNRYINHKIKGQLHEAKIVHTLNNTIWVDPVVRVTKLPDLKTYINEYNIRSEILATGFGVDNPEHICELQRLFREAEIAFEKKDMPQQRTDCFTLLQQTAIGDINPQKSLNFRQDACSLQRPKPGQLCLYCRKHLRIGPRSIKWFEKEDVVVLKIKVQNITNHDCKFFTQRIIGSAEGKFYLADLELQENIVEEKSRCVLRGNEVVVSLAKEKKGSWCRLLKQKNPHVSFDFDYLEDDSEESGFPISVFLHAFVVVAVAVIFPTTPPSGNSCDSISAYILFVGSWIWFDLVP
uniref:Putative ATP-dependent RNA helicase TDRD12 n=1 Tax=Anolis carolinensis TaxID=28377 RepID=R4GBG3_ANOCA